MTLVAPRAELDKLHAHAEAGYPHEVVGILAGKKETGELLKVHPLINERADSAHNRYKVSGLTLMRAEQALEAEGHDILGYYHSHRITPRSTPNMTGTMRSRTCPTSSFLSWMGRLRTPPGGGFWKTEPPCPLSPLPSSELETSNGHNSHSNPLRPYTDGAASVDVDGDTVGEALNTLTTTHAGLARHLRDDAGKLRSFVNVYLGEDDIRFLDGEDTALESSAVLTIVPSIAGGLDDLPELTGEEIARFSRHLILDEVGMAGQRKLKGSAVLCIGTGGLGSPLLMYLAAAGVGRIGIVDFDVVDESNLQRQVLHGTASVGRPKVQSAAERIKDINPHVQVDIYEEALTSENALKIVEPYDVVVDGTDNFPTRYLVNDACVILGKPNVYGSIFKFEGQASVFNYKGGPNYRDLYPEPPPPGLVPSCAEGWSIGHPAGRHWMHPGHRDHQDPTGEGRHPLGPAPPLRCPRHELPPAEAA